MIVNSEGESEQFISTASPFKNLKLLFYSNFSQERGHPIKQERKAAITPTAQTTLPE
jgi:hypothetical protein